MKAKQYFSEFKNLEIKHGFEKAIYQTVLSFYNECADLAQSRGKSDNAMVSIFKEQDIKWRAFAKNDSRIKQSGFRDFIISELPYVKQLAMW